jgi:transcriptional regulator with XRE-family HTH domain
LDYKKIGPRIKYLRETQEKTQEALAKAAKVSQSYIARVESGEVTPSVRVLERLAKVLGVSINDLMGGVTLDDYA